MPFSPDTTVGTLAAQFPRMIGVFQRFGIEPCCHANLALAEVCREQHLEIGELVKALTPAVAAPLKRFDWPTRPLAELMAHIVEAFHEPLRDELPRLLQLAVRLQHHGGAHRRALAVVLQELTRLRDRLDGWLGIEARDLFPLIQRAERGDVRTGDAERFTHLRAMLDAAQADARQTLQSLRQVTDGFRPPLDACSTLRGLYQWLDELERLVRLHVHLENSMLLPRAAALVSEAGIEGSR